MTGQVVGESKESSTFKDSSSIRHAKAPDTFVVWSSKKLSKEFGIYQGKVTKLLMSLGAKKWSFNKWYWDLDMLEHE